jgi:nitrilase
VLFVPSAFTAYTGRAHWTALLRARAIENLAYVVAPAQWGRHGAGRNSYGHTSVVDPWGRVIAERARGTGVVTARIDLDRVDRLRRELPVLDHVRRNLLPRRTARD